MPYLIGHHREATALITCPRRLDGSVEREQIGLVSDATDGIDDGGNLFGAIAQLAHQPRGDADVVGNPAHFTGGFLNHLCAMLGESLGFG